jgi:F0F1-type ATP synthase membrane subunit b/b'
MNLDLDMLAIVSQMAGALIFVICAIWMFNRWAQPAIVGYQAAKNAEVAEAEGRRDQIKAACNAARTEIERAEEDAREIRGRVQAVARRERAQALKQAQAEADRIVRNAGAELERARLIARDRLRIEFIEKALVKARTVAAGRVDATIDGRLVEATVVDVVARRDG